MKFLKCALAVLVLLACMITDPAEPSARDRHIVFINCDSATVISQKTGIDTEQAARIVIHRLDYGPLEDSRDLWYVEGLRGEVAGQLQADHGVSYAPCYGRRVHRE